MPTHMPGVFPDRRPDDIDTDIADADIANREQADKAARERQAAEAPSDDADDPHLQKRDNTTHPLNPPPERNSQIIAERDERPGS